jgi:hypothetical protein
VSARIFLPPCFEFLIPSEEKQPLNQMKWFQKPFPSCLHCARLSASDDPAARNESRRLPQYSAHHLSYLS